MNRKKRIYRLLFMVFNIFFAIAIIGRAGAEADPATIKAPDAATKSRIESKYLKMPMIFEQNQGQTDEKVKFLARGSGYNLFLTPSEATLVLSQPVIEKSDSDKASLKKEASLDLLSRKEKEIKKSVLNMRLLNANLTPDVSGLEKQDGKVNYLIGNDPKRWRTNIPTYSEVKYHDVYPGIDLIYYGKESQIEYDFVVAPGADPKAITLAFDGAKDLRINNKGDLVLGTEGGEIYLRKPIIYQEIDRVKKEIEGGFVLRGPKEAAFYVAAYDKGRPLIIDPVLSYSTYLGGSGSDFGQGIAVDSFGNAYVTGQTSSDFPVTEGAFDTTFNGGSGDAFVAKISPTPEERTDELIGEVEELVDAGVLNRGAGIGLTSKLEQAIALFNQGKTTGAIKVLNAFIAEVNGLIAGGELTPAQGQPLINLANATINQISG